MDQNERKGLFSFIPKSARLYFLLAIFFIASPTLSKIYPGAAGKFLVASANLDGTFFEDTIIYVGKHEIFGAYGFVINKQASSDDFEIAKEYFPAIDKLFIGGPVFSAKEERQKITAVLTTSPEHIHNFSITPISQLKDQNPVLFSKLRSSNNTSSAPIIAFYGYSGWSPWQLNIELLLGNWHVEEFDATVFFGDEQDQKDFINKVKK